MQEDPERLESTEDESTRRAASRVGQTLKDRWHLDSLLGIGGMAAVYAATHRNGKRVAIKILHRELSVSPEMKQRFIDEGYAANRVDHPAAVSVLDDDVSDDGDAFFVMDLLEGETLESRIQRRGRLEPDEILLIVDVLLDVLAAAHDKGIVHRDVKPDNIFITAEGKVKLLDFGIARMIEPGRKRTTQSGATMGTPAFMPPEQARGRCEQIDGRSDLWAVGASMFVALTGRQVHEGRTANEELLSAMTTTAPSLGAVAPALPKPLVELVDRALAYERDDRWSDARAMQAAALLVQALADEGTIPTTYDRISPSRPPIDSARPVTLVTPHPIVTSTRETGRGFASRSKHPMMLGGAAALALFLALMAIFSSRTRAAGSSNLPQPAAGAESSGSQSVTASIPVAGDPLIAPTVAAPDEPPADSAAARPAKPANEMSRPSKSTRAAVKTAASAQPGKAMQAPGVSPAPEPPLLSTPDPLDRRK